MRFVDRQGRVDRFVHKISAAAAKQAAVAAKKKAKEDALKETEVLPEEELTEGNEPPTYKQLLAKEQDRLKKVKKEVKAA